MPEKEAVKMEGCLEEGGLEGAWQRLGDQQGLLVEAQKAVALMVVLRKVADWAADHVGAALMAEGLMAFAPTHRLRVGQSDLVAV